MSGRAMEVESILRIPLNEATDVENVHKTIRGSLNFLAKLGEVSVELDANIGAVFQEMLGRADTKIDGHLGREYPVGSVSLENALQENELLATTNDAVNLCKQVRVKIEDANDLGLAGTVLEDCRGFFEQLHALAQVKGVSVFSLWEELRCF